MPEFQTKSGCGGPGAFGQGHHNIAALAGQAHQQIVVAAKLAATHPRSEHQQTVAILARGERFHLEAPDRQRIAVACVGRKHAFENRVLFAELCILGFHRAHLLREVLLRRAFDRELAVGRVRDHAQPLEFRAGGFELALEFRSLLAGLAQVVTGKSEPGVKYPERSRGAKPGQQRKPQPPHGPGHLRAHSHLWRGDAEALSKLPQDRRFHGRPASLGCPCRIAA